MMSPQETTICQITLKPRDHTWKPVEHIFASRDKPHKVDSYKYISKAGYKIPGIRYQIPVTVVRSRVELSHSPGQPDSH